MDTLKLLIKILFSIVLLASTSCSSIYDEEVLNADSRSSTLPETKDYPLVFDILSDSKTFAEMERAWNMTIQLATPQGRQEIGFYIYYDFESKTFSTGEWVYGPVTPNTVNSKSTVTLGKPINNTTVCAFFHTHPPMRFVSGSRQCGPSDEDIDFALSNEIPGILIDHTDKFVYGRDKIDFPTEEEYIEYAYEWQPIPFGPIRRKSPYFINID